MTAGSRSGLCSVGIYKSIRQALASCLPHEHTSPMGQQLIPKESSTKFKSESMFSIFKFLFFLINPVTELSDRTSYVSSWSNREKWEHGGCEAKPGFLNLCAQVYSLAHRRHKPQNLVKPEVSKPRSCFVVQACVRSLQLISCTPPKNELNYRNLPDVGYQRQTVQDLLWKRPEMCSFVF